MTISEQTFHAMAAAIRSAVADALDDEDLAEVALKSFGDNASLSDWDELEKMKEV